jgi:hypothetical protein
MKSETPSSSPGFEELPSLAKTIRFLKLLDKGLTGNQRHPKHPIEDPLEWVVRIYPGQDQTADEKAAEKRALQRRPDSRSCGQISTSSA